MKYLIIPAAVLLIVFLVDRSSRYAVITRYSFNSVDVDTMKARAYFGHNSIEVSGIEFDYPTAGRYGDFPRDSFALVTVVGPINETMGIANAVFYPKDTVLVRLSYAGTGIASNGEVIPVQGSMAPKK